MAKSKKKLVFVLLCIVVLIFGGYKIFNKKNNNPVSTEMMILNAKNEKVSMPYINPEWIEYMKLSEEEKENIENVPEKYIYNYIPEDNLYDNYEELPSRFNLRDEYATTVKNQGSEGLCWAYATTSAIESNLKLRKNIDENFSPQQISKVVSGSRTPTYLNMSYGDGLRFVNEIGFANSIISSGFIPVRVNEYQNNVVDSSVVRYFIRNTVDFPKYQNTIEYRNMLKSYIKNYGAVYFTSTAPDARSGSFYNKQYNMLDVHYESYEIKTAIPRGAKFFGHAMIITGWDDNYGPDSDGDGNPDGAWIIQNSWGEAAEKNPFPYISYNSEINYLRGIKIVENRDWDNNYSMASYPTIQMNGEVIEQEKSIFKDLEFYKSEQDNKLLNATAVMGSVEATYTKYSTKEELKYINFTSASQNSTYKIYVSANGNSNNYQFIKDVVTDMPGLYTVDIDNIELSGKNFSIKIMTENGAVYTQINAFTNNIEEKPEVYDYYDQGAIDDDNYVYHVFIHNNELPEECTMVVKDKNGKTCNTSDGNGGRVRAFQFNQGAVLNVKLPKEIACGEEIIVELYGNSIYNVLHSVTIINNPELTIEGSGIESDPFIIKNAKEFTYIKAVPNAFYKLDGDIDFSELDDFTGFGADFTGVLDGNGHKILNYNGNTALFKEVSNAKIFNLTLDKISIELDETDNKYEGVLAKKIADSHIENVSITGKFKGYSGAIIANTGNNTTVKDVFINYSVDGYGIGSIFRDVETRGSTPETNTIENAVIVVQLNCNSEIIDGQYNGGVVFGITSENHFSRKSKINNVVVYAKVRNSSDGKEITYYPVSREYNSNIENVYEYVDLGEGCVLELNEYGYEVDGLVIESDYEEFKEHAQMIFRNNDNWRVEENELPKLKDKSFVFMKNIGCDEQISVEVDETKSINISVDPTNADNGKIEYISNNPEIVKVESDGKITGISEGIATIKVSTCDGTNINKSIKVIVGNPQITEDIKIHTYDCDEDKKIIDNILPTTIEHYKENINLQEPYIAKVFKGKEEVTEGNIASGMITKIYLNGESVAEYTNIVPGDADGDGKISSRDVSKVGQYLEGLNIINEQNESYILLAMDFTRDGKVTQNDKEDIQKYVVGIIKRIEEIYYGLIEPYKINKYNSDEEKKTISNIFPATIEHYKENINIQNPYTIKVFNGNEEITEGNIATGMITKIYLNDEILAEYTNIVPGDVYMDGKISSRDAGMTQQYLIGMKDELYDTPQYYAMDFSRDGKVRLNDVELIMRYGVKLYEPSEEDYYGENN